MAKVHHGIPRASHPNLLCSPLTPPPQSFYLHPSPHTLASGPNLDETNGGNLDKCTDETNNYLVPEGSFFPEGWWCLEDYLCRWTVTGLLELGFMCPFHFHSACPCENHLICCPANAPRGWHSGRSPVSAWLSPSAWELFWGYCESNGLQVQIIHSRQAGQRSCTFWMNCHCCNFLLFFSFCLLYFEFWGITYYNDNWKQTTNIIKDVRLLRCFKLGGLANQNGLQPRSKNALKPLDKLECRTTLDWVSKQANYMSECKIYKSKSSGSPAIIPPLTEGCSVPAAQKNEKINPHEANKYMVV